MGEAHGSAGCARPASMTTPVVCFPGGCLERRMVGRLMHRGFSILELVAVIVILSLIAAIAVPRYAAATQRHEVEADAARLAADLDFARRSARSTSHPWRVLISEDGTSYTVEALPAEVLDDITPPVIAGVSDGVNDGALSTLDGTDGTDSGSGTTNGRSALLQMNLDASQTAELMRIDGGPTTTGARTTESELSAAQNGATGLTPRVLQRGKIVDQDVINSKDELARSIIFDAYGIPSRGFRLVISVGRAERTVKVSEAGAVSWQ